MTILKSAFVWWCCRLPFDWKTPITYLMALAIMYVVLIHVYIFASAAISFEIGSYLWVVEFIEDIKHDTESINKIAKSRRNRWQTMQRLRDSIEFHCHIKQFSICFLNFRWNIRISTVWSWPDFTKFRLVRNVSNIGEPMLTAVFSWSLVTICGTLLIVQMQLV